MKSLMKVAVVALTLVTVPALHAQEPLSLVSKDGRLSVTIFGGAVKYALDGKSAVVCNGQSFNQEGIDNFGSLYKSYAQACADGTGVFIKHFTETHEVQVAVTDGQFRETIYRNAMYIGAKS